MAKTVEDRLAALESRFAADEKVDEVVEQKEDEGKTARESLIAEINQLDSIIASKMAAEEDELKDDEKVASKELADKFNKKGSLVDPKGIEEQITQDKFHAVEDLEHGRELATQNGKYDGTVLDAAPTGYVANLKQASARLDKVAAYLEKHGRMKEAFRIDKIADAIDEKIEKLEVK